MKIKLGRDGKLAIPAEYRKQLCIGSGDVLSLEVVDGDARLRLVEHSHGRSAVNSVDSTSDLKIMVRVSSSGAIKLPAEVRQQLGMNQGDTVITIVEDGGLLVYTFARLTQYVQNMARKYPPFNGRLVSEDLIRQRRAEARAEERYG